MKLIEEKRMEKLKIRREMINSFENFWLDVDAVRRVAKINGETDKLDYNHNLKKEEKEKLLNRYENIKDLSSNKISIIRTLINNKRDEKYFKESLPEDAIWLNDIIWKESDLIEYVEFLKEIGINKIYYTDHSTACLEVMVWLTKLEAKVIGTTKISEYNEGLIIEL